MAGDLAQEGLLLGIADHTLATWLDRVCARRGDAIALSGVDGLAISYRDLGEQLRQAGEALRRCGIGRGDVVMIALPDGPPALWAFLAVARVATAFPVPAQDQPEHYARLLQRSGAKAVLMEDRPGSPLTALAAAQGLTLIRLLPGAPCVLDAVRPAPARKAEAPADDDIATITLTSGTTAQPKLVASTHLSLHTSIRHVADWMDLGEIDRALCVMPIAHLHSLVRTTLPVLLQGGEAVWAPGFDRARILDWLDRLRPTYITAVPSLYRLLLQEIARAGWRARDPSLRRAGIGSDRVEEAMVAELRQRLDIPVLQFYGLTETCPFIAMATPDTPPGVTGRINPVWQVRCVDESGVDVPPGADGEIVVRGGIVNPLLGAESASLVDGWFHTRDVGRLAPDGCLTVTGRLGDRIVRGGQKVQPEPVEEALRRHPAVAEAVAFGLPDPILGQTVAAVIVARPGAAPGAEAVLAFAATSLADHQMPERLFIAERIPTNRLGKVSRTDLAAHFAALVPQSAAQHAPPPPETVARVLAILREALDAPGFAADLDFFADGGGDSLAALNAGLAIEAAFRTNVPPASLRRHPTAVALASFIARQAASRAPQIVAVQSAGDRPPLFLAHNVDGRNSFAPELAARLGADRPLYTFHETEIANATAAERGLDAMAQRWVAAIRSVQPHGPYHLAGHSWGARLAFAMAQHLRGAGEEVAFLGMIDGRPRLNERTFGAVATTPPDATPTAWNRWALRCHTPSFYDRRITYFRATEELAIHRSLPAGGWDFLAADVAIVDIAGDHLSVVEGDGIAPWSAAFEAALNRPAPEPRGSVASPARAKALDAAEACRRGDRGAEIALYQEALALDPALPHWIFGNLANALLEDGQTEPAVAAYRQAVARDPWPLTTLVRFAWMLKRRRLKDLLREGAAMAAGIPAADGATALQKARVLWLARRHADAERAFADGVRVSPGHPHLLVAYAALLAQLGRHAEARAVLRAGAGRHPERNRNRALLERKLAELDASAPEPRRPWLRALLRRR
jgi:acyl-CoA synthetase (AMP-forming)/AMP-acid ligase II/thioesterase domain-containing protein/acyl carrier protein